MQLLEAGTSRLIATTTSDGSGAWSFTLGGNAGNYYVSAYKSGSPDQGGVSAATLVAT